MSLSLFYIYKKINFNHLICNLGIKKEHSTSLCTLVYKEVFLFFLTMKYFILTEKQCNIINQKCIKHKYCHGDHIKTKKIVDSI